MKAIILAAGVGRRLGRQMPKSLIRLGNGKTILAHQLNGLLRLFRPQDITVVVGFNHQFTHLPLYGFSKADLKYLADAVLESVREMRQGTTA